MPFAPGRADARQSRAHELISSAGRSIRRLGDRARKEFSGRRSVYVYRRYVRGGLPNNPQQPQGTAVPVILCLWQRPNRLPEILRLLEEQSGVRLQLYVWNNARAYAHIYDSYLASYRPAGAVQGVSIATALANVGGAARFLVSRDLHRGGYRGPIVLIDDDQDLKPTFVAELLGAWRDRTLAGVWAWRIHGDYWDRSEALNGQDASYVGTGGSVGDAALLGSEDLLSDLPVGHLFLEDMWLSAFALRSGWRLCKVDAPFTFTDQGADQWHAIAAQKSRFYDELGRPGSFPRQAEAGSLS